MRRALTLPVALLLTLGWACAPRRVTPGVPAGPLLAARPASLDASAPAVPSPPSLPSLEALAARASALAPGMREVARGDLSSSAPSSTIVLVPPEAPDTCTRVTLVAQPSVHASLATTRGDLLADVPSSADTPLGARGPVCVRKGDGIKLTVDAGGVWTARFVAWSSP